jgi:hypothetical protein
MEGMRNGRLFSPGVLTIVIRMMHARQTSRSTAATTPPQRALGAHELLSIADVAGLRIRCVSGSLWLTLDRDPRDIVLRAGEEYCGEEHRRGLVYAFEPSVLALEPVGGAAQPAVRRAVSPRPQVRTPAHVPV